MNSSFYINNLIANEPLQLLLEIGESDIVFAILQGNIFTALASYHFTNLHEVDNLFKTEALLQFSFTKVDIVYSNKQCALVPPIFFNASALHTHLELIYGHINYSPIKSDFLFRHNIHTVYQVDNTLLNSVSTKFPYANTHHLYSLLPDVAELKGNKLYTIFYANKIVVVCCKENNLQLIQQFEYTTPEDVSYYLLAVINNHHMKTTELILTIGGMIDITSSLYNELHKYFKHIVFDSFNIHFKYSEEIQNLPEHYFSPLLSIAACV